MFRFRSAEPITSRDSVFIGPEAISDVMLASMMFESADQHVFKTMTDSMCAMYQAVSCGDMEIAREGLGDMAKSAWEFFKSIIKKIATFIKNAFNYLMSYVLDFEKFIDQYKENLNNFKEFEISGYTYTIDTEPIDNAGISKIVDRYNTDIDKVKKMELVDIQKLISQELGKDSIGELRAKLCGKSGIIKPDKFVREMEKKFRNGKGSKGTIKVNSGLVSSFIDEFKKYKELLDSVKEDGYNVQGVLNDMADFFHGMPTYEYKDSDDKRIQHYKISADAKKGEFKADKSGEESHSTDYYKKLTTYYNFCYRMCRDIAGIYSKAYMVKVAALKEAVGFYKTVIRKALSPFADKVKDEITPSKESVGIVPTMEFISHLSESGDDPLTMAECHEATLELKKFTGSFMVIEPITKLGMNNNVIATLGFVGWTLGESAARQECRRIAELATKKSKKYRFRISSNVAVIGTTPFHMMVYAFRKKDKESDTEKNSIWMENLASLYVGDVDDYSIQAMEAMHEIEVAEWDTHFREYVNEIDVLAEGYRRGYILMEDVEVKEKSGPDAKESTFSKIIEFIRTIIAKFMDKASNLFNSNQEWFDKYSGKLDEVSAEAYDNIKITMLAYHKQNKYDIPRTSVLPNDARLGTEKFKTLEEVAKLMYPGICKLSATKDITEGTKIYFRGGSNKVETYSNGADVKTQVTMMAEWCKEYTDTCHHIKDQIDKMTEEMEKMDKAYEASKESSSSYVLAEQALLEETGLAWLPFIDSKGNTKFLVLKEADGDGDKKKAQEEKKEGQEAAKAAGATADDGKKEAKPETEEERKAREEKEAAEKKAKDEKVSRALAAKYYYQVKVKVATAMLTIAEERFVSYVKTLRNVVALAHIAADKAENPDKAKK